MFQGLLCHFSKLDSHIFYPFTKLSVFATILWVLNIFSHIDMNEYVQQIPLIKIKVNIAAKPFKNKDH
jgi:hypothetical protein